MSTYYDTELRSLIKEQISYNKAFKDLAKKQKELDDKFINNCSLGLLGTMIEKMRYLGMEDSTYDYLEDDLLLGIFKKYSPEKYNLNFDSRDTQLYLAMDTNTYKEVYIQGMKYEKEILVAKIKIEEFNTFMARLYKLYHKTEDEFNKYLEEQSKIKKQKRYEMYLKLREEFGDIKEDEI